MARFIRRIFRAGGIAALLSLTLYWLWAQAPEDLGHLAERVSPAANDLFARTTEMRQKLNRRGAFCPERHYVVALTTFIPESKAHFAYRTFVGDGRDFDVYASSYRTRQVVVVAPDVKDSLDPVVAVEESVGRTIEFDNEGRPARTGFASVVGSVKSSGRDSGERWLEISVESGDPLVTFAPTIDARLRIQFTPDGRTMTYQLTDDGFPNAEVVILDPLGNVLAHTPCDARRQRNTPIDLFPFLGDEVHDPQTLRLF